YEFDDCLVHRLEADGLLEPSARNTLIADDFDPGELRKLRIAGYEIEGELITALPHAGYDMRSYRVRPARPTRIVEEGDIVATGASRSCSGRGTRPGASGCGKPRPGSCSPATPSMTGRCWMSSIIRTSRTTSGRCAGCARCRCASCMPATIPASAATG